VRALKVMTQPSWQPARQEELQPRVLIVQAGDFRSFPLGGTLTLLRAFLRHIAGEMQIALVGTTCGSEPVGRWTKIVADGNEFPFFPVAVAREGSRLPTRIKLVSGLFHYRRRLLERPTDVLFAQSGEAAFPFVWLRDRPPIAIYLHCTENPFKVARPAWVRFLLVAGLLYRCFYEAPFRRVERILVSSGAAEFQTFVSAHPSLAAKAASIPAGFQEDLFFPQDQAESRDFVGVDSRARLVLFVGRLERQKNLLFMLDSFALLREKYSDASLVIVGNGSQQGEIEERIRSHQLEGCVRLVGRKSPAEIARWMNAADVFVLPSVWEAFGIVGLEALACGTPVVASRVGGMPDLIAEGETGYVVDPLTPLAFAQAIGQVLEKGSLMRQHCRSRAEPFTMKAMSERISRELLKVWNRPAQRPEPILTVRGQVP
jgi:glycosyltransferase involved in cell wall biosynthesis